MEPRMTATDLPGVVWFQGSATLEAHRGKGVYRSLVASRLAAAREAA
jgi:hypothetical protein